MREVLLLRFGEVHLKGLNRPVFLKKLTENVKKAVSPLGADAFLSDARIYVVGASDPVEALDRARRVFGIHSVSPAWEIEKDFEAIAGICLALAAPLSGTFKVQARRSDKRFPMNSMEIERELGGRILDANPNLRVDVHRPQHQVCVEIRDRAAYAYVSQLPAVGGMPTGTGGRAMLLLSGGIDSPVAGFQLMKRGVKVNAVHFFSFPYTSERAKEKVFELARILGRSQDGMKVYVAPFTQVQMTIQEKCPDGLHTLLGRRFMMRVAEKLAQKDGAQALITGESLGQVASQTMEAIACTDAATALPVFRPLIGLDKLEITEIAQRIGTYATSILPYEDCCTVFTPRHPTTRPKLAQAEAAEATLDIDGLVNAAIEGVEAVVL
ncbi:MAG: tRNA 4-thiouridine(8) synthase ThiI [Clostridiales bacterium]|nr:tRNA 4-thiouridine(8) synthase ThiI [Clostridiales bacterium]